MPCPSHVSFVETIAECAITFCWMSRSAVHASITFPSASSSEWVSRHQPSASAVVSHARTPSAGVLDASSSVTPPSPSIRSAVMRKEAVSVSFVCQAHEYGSGTVPRTSRATRFVRCSSRPVPPSNVCANSAVSNTHTSAAAVPMFIPHPPVSSSVKCSTPSGTLSRTRGISTYFMPSLTPLHSSRPDANVKSSPCRAVPSIARQ